MLVASRGTKNEFVDRTNMRVTPTAEPFKYLLVCSDDERGSVEGSSAATLGGLEVRPSNPCASPVYH